MHTAGFAVSEKLSAASQKLAIEQDDKCEELIVSNAAQMPALQACGS